jgi:hypothetical protein
VTAVRLSEAQRVALERGSSARWQDAATVGVNGPAFDTFAHRGLAVVATAGDVGLPGKRSRLVYRLTPAGVRERRRRRPLGDLTVDALVAMYVDGDLARADLEAELERRAGVELVRYLWPTGERSSV